VNDKLNVLKVHTHLYFDLLNKAKETFSRSLRPKTPLMCIVGDGDVIINKDLVIKHFSEVDKMAKLVVVKEAYHELYHEIPEYYGIYTKSIQEFFN
jgi:alpha-beta hydrolase superfamily lysophospholipase